MHNIISIKDTFYYTSSLGEFVIQFTEALFDYEEWKYGGIIVIINPMNTGREAWEDPYLYTSQRVTLHEITPILGDGRTRVHMEELDKALSLQEEDMLTALKQSWGPYWWEDTLTHAHQPIVGEDGVEYDAPRYGASYRKDAMVEI